MAGESASLFGDPMFGRFLPLARILAAFGALAASRLAAHSLRVEASATWAENISRSAAASDWRDATKYETRGQYSHFREWHRGFFTSGEIAAGLEHVPRFTALDTLTLGASGQLRQKFGLGPFAPALALDAGLARRDARLDPSDGWTLNAALRLGQRFAPAWRAALAGDWQQHCARSPIFDTKHHRAYGTITWDLSDRWSLTHGNGRLWGSFTANASSGVWSRALSGALGSALSTYYNAISWGATGAFGPGWVTYLVDGRVSFWWLELSPALGRNTSLPLRYDSLVSVNHVGVKYRQDLWTVQVLHRF
ncbi:MAG: hypothetical protein FJ399_06860 [Verrucomicrobia bacterium]|nr:hypothetical protein [Verrucomicrobiota bacterium]